MLNVFLPILLSFIHLPKLALIKDPVISNGGLPLNLNYCVIYHWGNFTLRLK
jgi:hypothetical protein